MAAIIIIVILILLFLLGLPVSWGTLPATFQEAPDAVGFRLAAPVTRGAGAAQRLVSQHAGIRGAGDGPRRRDVRLPACSGWQRDVLLL